MVQDLKGKVREQAAEWAGAEKEPGTMKQPGQVDDPKNLAAAVDKEKAGKEDFRNKWKYTEMN